MRPPIRAAAAALMTLTLCNRVAAQRPVSDGEPPAVGSSFTDDTLQDLPIAGNVYALLETTQPEVISDRFNNGGLNVGGFARVGGFLSSWSQTSFRIGDLDVSDPWGSGAALLFPETLFWREVRVDTGLMPADISAPGLAATLLPKRPAAAWTGTVTGFGSGGGLAASAPEERAPPVARLRDYGSGSALFGGPVTDRLGIVAAGTWMAASRYDRERLPASRQTLFSGFSQVVFARSASQEWRAIGWVQRAETPFQEWQAFQDPSAATKDTSVHFQSTWDQHPASGSQWRAFAGFTGRSRSNLLVPGSVTVERIAGGPVPSIVEIASDADARRIGGGFRFSPRPADRSARHQLAFGADVSYASGRSDAPFRGAVREFVDTIPARVWTYTAGAAASQRHSTTIAGYASDSLSLSPSFQVDASVRLELIHGRAADAATAIDWRSALPAARLRWLFAERRGLALMSGYARTANALNLNLLAYGDPAAPVASVAAATAPNTVVARVGPGTGGNPAFSRIDDDLGRPHSDEFVVGLEWRRRPSTRFTLTGLARREGNLIGVVNTGVPASGYSTIGVPDLGADHDSAADDRILAVYNRLPQTFGEDRYVLTNPGQEAATVFALKLAAEHAGTRLFTLFGATAYAAEGSGGNRGYGPVENDPDVPGELFANPNAATYARGRLFSDRAFTIKWTTAYRFGRGFTASAIARYQDGQPFSRIVVVPGLNQGTEGVQGYPNGGTRFTFTGTLDLRVQKRFTIGVARLDAILDAYNLLTRSNEVEEYVVTGPAFRTPTYIEPPASVHVGVRLTF
jgi:hypothetical protein